MKGEEGLMGQWKELWMEGVKGQGSGLRKMDMDQRLETKAVRWWAAESQETCPLL